MHRRLNLRRGALQARPRSCKVPPRRLSRQLYAQGADVLGLQEQMRERMGLEAAPAAWSALLPHLRFAVSPHIVVVGGQRGS